MVELRNISYIIFKLEFGVQKSKLESQLDFFKKRVFGNFENFVFTIDVHSMIKFLFNYLIWCHFEQSEKSLKRKKISRFT